MAQERFHRSLCGNRLTVKVQPVVLFGLAQVSMGAGDAIGVEVLVRVAYLANGVQSMKFYPFQIWTGSEGCDARVGHQRSP